MSTADLIRLCPWLLPKPRPFTKYELAVVREAVADGMTIHNKKIPRDNGVEANSLVHAIQVSVCPAFQANFGPAPSVPYSFYVCIGQIYAKLDLTSRQGIDSQIMSGQLCGATSTFSPCNNPNAAVDILLASMPAASAMMTQLGLPKPVIKPAEGLPQYTSFMAPTNADENLRARSAYQATTGRKILDLVTAMQRIPGVTTSFPPAVQQLLALANSPMAAMFLDREFILAASIRGSIDPTAIATQITTVFGRGPTAPPTPAELSQLATLIIEDVVAIWAPGLGFSVLPYILGQADPTQIIGLLTGIGLGGVIPPGVIPPGVIPPDLATQLGNIFGGFFPPGKLHGVPSKLGSVRWLNGPGNLGAYVGPPHPVIQQGSVGIYVVEWQNILIQDASTSKYTAPADGTFGPITDAATKLWQTAHGIVPDGVVGQATWTAAYVNYVPSNTYISPGMFDLLRLLVTPVNELTASDYKEPPLPAGAVVVNLPASSLDLPTYYTDPGAGTYAFTTREGVKAFDAASQATIVASMNTLWSSQDILSAPPNPNYIIVVGPPADAPAPGLPVAAKALQDLAKQGYYIIAPVSFVSSGRNFIFATKNKSQLATMTDPANQDPHALLITPSDVGATTTASTGGGGSDSTGLLVIGAVVLAVGAALMMGGGGASAAKANPTLPARPVRRSGNPQEHVCVGGEPSTEYSWWEHDAQGIPLYRVCDRCRDAKLSTYRPEILSGYDQSDVDEPIEPEENPVSRPDPQSYSMGQITGAQDKQAGHPSRADASWILVKRAAGREPINKTDYIHGYKNGYLTGSSYTPGGRNTSRRRKNPCGCGAKRSGPGMLAKPACVCGGY